MAALSRRRVLMVVGAILGTIPLLGASCAVSQQFQNSGAPKVQFVGDSITVQATDDINSHFGGDHDVAINAYVGATAYEQMSNIGPEAASQPQVAVINLGTNDAGVVITGRTITSNGVTNPWDPVEPITNVEARLDSIAAQFAPACLVFVTIDTQDSAWYGANGAQAVANAEALNDHIRAMPGIQVADWDANLSAADFDVNNGVSTAPHPNEVGRQEMLTLEEQAISRCPPPATTTSTSTVSSTTSTTSGT